MRLCAVRLISRGRLWKGCRGQVGLVVTLLAGLTVFASMLVGCTASAWAQAPEPQVEVVPSAVMLRRDGEAEVLVITRNRAGEPLQDLQLSYFTDVDVNVTVVDPSSDVVPGYGTRAWTLRLSRPGDGPVSGVIHLRLDYVWQREGAGGTVPGVAHTTLKMTTPAPERVEDVVEVEVRTTLDSLAEHRPGMVHVVVANISEVPVRVKSIVPSGPPFVTFPVSPPGTVVALAPNEGRAFPIRVEATDAVQPGKHLLLFEVALEWEKAGHTWAASLVETHEVEIGVLGESGIVGVLGLATVAIPSFLVLPGFLMITSWRLLAKIVPPRRQDLSFVELKDVKSPEFWFVAITLSFVGTLLYPRVTGLFGDPRDLLVGYGLRDVIMLWFASTVFAAVTYFVVVGGGNLLSRFVKWQEERAVELRTPSAKDDPITVLRKLDRQGLGIWRDRLVIVYQGEEENAFLLQEMGEGQERVWVGPRISVTWGGKAEPDLQRELEDQLKGDGDAGVVARLLATGRDRDVATIRWERDVHLNGPHHAYAQSIIESLEPISIVEMSPPD